MKQLVCFSVLFFLSTSAFALDTELSTNPENNSSTVNRKDKERMLVGSPISIGPSGTFEMGGTFGKYLDPYTILQFEIGTGDTSDNWESVYSDSTHWRSNSVSLNVKKFLGNTFYIKGGIDYRNISYSYNYDFNFLGTDNSSSYSFDADSWTGSFAIGNQWQWENFTLGCDWVGVSVPVITHIHNEKWATTDATDTTQQDLRSKESQYVKNVALQGLHFYLGASF